MTRTIPLLLAPALWLAAPAPADASPLSGPDVAVACVACNVSRALDAALNGRRVSVLADEMSGGLGWLLGGPPPFLGFVPSASPRFAASLPVWTPPTSSTPPAFTPISSPPAELPLVERLDPPAPTETAGPAPSGLAEEVAETFVGSVVEGASSSPPAPPPALSPIFSAVFEQAAFDLEEALLPETLLLPSNDGAAPGPSSALVAVPTPGALALLGTGLLGLGLVRRRQDAGQA